MAGKQGDRRLYNRTKGETSWIILPVSLCYSIAGGACAVIVPLVLTVALGIFLYSRYRQGNMAKQAAQSWPSTTGTVLASTVQIRRTGRSHSEIPVVIYQYEVNGNVHQGQTVKAGDQFMSVRLAGEAHATAARA